MTINRSYGRIKAEEEFVVYNPCDEPDVNATIKMEVRSIFY